MDLDQLNRKRKHRSHSRHRQDLRPSSERTREVTNENREFTKSHESSSSPVAKFVNCDNGQFREFRVSRKDINGNSHSSSDENIEGTSERFDLSSVKQSLNSLKQIVKANQPSRVLSTNLLFEGFQSGRSLSMDIDGVNGNVRNLTKPRAVNINNKARTLYGSRDLNTNRTEEQRVNDNDVKRHNTIVNDNTRSNTIDNEHSRLRNINRGNLHVLKMNRSSNSVSNLFLMNYIFH